MNKKIVITSNTSWFISNFFSSSIVEFMDNNNQIYIIAPRDKYTDKLIELGCHFREIYIDRSGINPKHEIKTLKQLIKLLSDIDPDCVLNFTPKLNIYSVIACRILNIPVINNVAGMGSIESENGIKPLIGKILLRTTQPLAHHIIFQNSDDQSLYLKKKYTRLEKVSRVNGIGVQLQHFHPCPAKDDQVVRFILFARMLRNKGIIEFIQAANAVNQYYKQIAQEGMSIPKFEFSLLGFIDESNPQGISLSELLLLEENSIVSYLGETDDVFSVVKEYDCVVLPSYYQEGIPQCLIESCAMAKPIITTSNVGCRETVVDGISGFIVTPKNISELKDAMIKMIELPHSQRLKMGQYGRQKAERDFCHIKVAKHYMNIIKKILSK